MPRTCTLCTHPDRAAIDTALLRGEACAQISRDFAVSADAAERHRRAHLPAAMVAAQGAAELTRADTLLGRLGELSRRAEGLHRDVEKILRRAQRERDPATVLEAVRTACHVNREGRGVFDLVFKVAIAGVEAEVKRRLAAEVEAILRNLALGLPDEMYSRVLDLLAADGGERADSLLTNLVGAIRICVSNPVERAAIAAELQRLVGQAFERKDPC